MPVRKFRSAEEMNQPVWCRADDLELQRIIAALWRTGRNMSVRHFTPGVRRYRSIEEMSRDQSA